MTPTPLRSTNLPGMGERLRDLRQARGLSISELASASGVPRSTISKIENLQLNPSLVHAINLATALNENLGFLIEDDTASASDFSVVRSKQRPRLNLPEMDIVLEDLQGSFPRGLLEARLGTIRPGATSGEEEMRHPGEEFCYVLSGALRYEIEGVSYDLAAGDSIHFRCEDNHRWTCSDEQETRVIWVFSDRLSF